MARRDLARRRVVPLVAAAVVAVSVASSTAAPAAAADLLEVGTVDLTRCRLAGVVAWCGSIQVPLDYTDPAAATITVGFGWLPARSPGARTVVAQEGGPGYPSTGTIADYVDMLGPDLLAARNLLVVDERGTGRSTPVDCPGLQRTSTVTTSAAYLAATAACGAALDHTFRRAGGGYVHASDLFDTANGARDMAAVLRALRQGPVDLYGDSYGTYFAQAFLARYPQLVAHVVLDAAYEARDLDPWYRTTVTTARFAFHAVCERQPDCQSLDLPPEWTTVARLAASLRGAPVVGPAPTPEGGVRQVTVDMTALVDMVNDAGYDFGPLRDLTAAATSYLDDGDATPLLRLWAQDLDFDYATVPVGYYSQGLYQAVSCTDYPQLFDMRSTPPQRRAELAASVAALPDQTFAPFTTAEWISLSPNVESYSACTAWPAPTHASDPPVPPGTPLNPHHVPVLILNGDLDSLTPAAGGSHIAAQMGGGARAVTVRNMVHLVGVDDPYGCGRGIVQRFLADPDDLAGLDVSCRTTTPPLGVVPEFPASLATTPPADGDGPSALRRLAWVAAGTVADVDHRAGYLAHPVDHGLHGGTSQTVGDRTWVQGWRWVPDVRASGEITVDGLTGHADLDLTTDGGRTEHCRITWTVSGPFDPSTTVCAGMPFATTGI